MPDGPAEFPHDQSSTETTRVSGTDTREISTISFPYCHMEDAMGIARAMLEQGDIALRRDQLEELMATKGGNFASKFGAARMFGFVQRNKEGKFYLSDLGHAILSSNERQNFTARRDAFFNIPLYKKTFVEFKDTTLPPRPTGLENTFVQMGVAPKQKEKARGIFERSAHYAGFFRRGTDRLIEPAIPLPTEVAPSPTTHNDDMVHVAENFGRRAIPTNPMEEPLIRGLLIRLPEVGSDWPAERRVQWLQLLANVLDVVYAGAAEQGPSEKHIEVKIAAALP